jgi:GxxExxY protein
MTNHDPLTHQIIGCAMEVHRQLGPGLLEATYEEALCIELKDQEIQFTRQAGVPVFYKGHDLVRIPLCLSASVCRNQTEKCRLSEEPE